MDFTISFTLLSCIILTLFFCVLKSNLIKRRSAKQLPPGPYPFPIIGNILQLGENPHQSLAKLSKIYGPLMHIKLGSINTIVVSSPEMAKQILQEHDHAFPGRMAVAAARALGHHKTSMATLPVGRKWRGLRKICREQMLSTHRLDSTRDLRQEKLRELRDYVQKCCDDGRSVDIGEAAFVTSLNLISNTLFSINFAEYESGSSQELKEIVHGVMRILGTPNLADCFPALGLFDPQGIKRKAEFYFGKLLGIFDGIIVKRLESSRNSAKKNDLLDSLLGISGGENQSELNIDDIKHLLMDLFVAGTDTSAGTVEWVMTELLRNPNILSKAKYELRATIGKNKQVEESDISRLPYLQALIKETLRYHPPGPFISRYKDDQRNLEIDTYVIPKNVLVLVNLWAIGRDSKEWINPDSFKPERFLHGEIDVKGHNFELIPFGAGRRICPGLPLAYRMVHLLVASLIHNFDWKLETGMNVEEMDVSEKFGLSLQKSVPLKLVPILDHEQL